MGSRYLFHNPRVGYLHVDMSATQMKRLKALHLKKLKLVSDERAEHLLMQEKLQKAIDFLPATVLMQYNMMDACKDRAKKTMVKTISKLLQAFLRKGFARWVDVVKAWDEHRRAAAVLLATKIILGYLARKRVKRLRDKLSDAEYRAHIKRRQLQLQEVQRIITIQSIVRGWLARVKYRRLTKRIKASNFIKTFFSCPKAIASLSTNFKTKSGSIRQNMLITKGMEG